MAALRSMTGFGTGVRNESSFHVSVELRSVNHRYMKVSSRVPEDLPWLQERVESAVRKRFGRGAVNVTVRIDQATQAGRVQVDRALLANLVEELQEAAQELGVESGVQLRDLLPLEGVVRSAADVLPGDADQKLQEAVDGALEAAFEKITEMQVREGRHLSDELTRILGEIEGALDGVVELAPEAADQNRDRYQRRLEDFLRDGGVEIAPTDVLREVAILAEKADITEETERLRGHLLQYREALDMGDRVGRKLDFLAQEMLREANTMAAKANHLALSQLVVELKTEIDRLREQTQNIE